MSERLREAPVDSLVSDLQVTVENLKVLTAQLNNPNSSVGKRTKRPRALPTTSILP